MVLYGSTTTSEGAPSEDEEPGKTLKLKISLEENSSLNLFRRIDPKPEPVPPPSE